MTNIALNAMQLEISLSAGKLNPIPENRFESSKSPKIEKIRPVSAFEIT